MLPLLELLNIADPLSMARRLGVGLLTRQDERPGKELIGAQKDSGDGCRGGKTALEDGQETTSTKGVGGTSEERGVIVIDSLEISLR